MNELISRSFKDRSADSIFKCEKCNFLCPNDMTMKVHYKRILAEKLTCGLCNFESDEVENLETFKCNRSARN